MHASSIYKYIYEDTPIGSNKYNRILVIISHSTPHKPVNTPQAGLYEYNALVRNHTRALYSLHAAQLGVY